MKILTTLVFSLITIIIISTELYLKKIGLGDPIRYDSNIFYGYAPKSNQKKNRLNNSLVSINNVGLRSIYNWDDNKKKIIFLGDSVTYGGSFIDDKEIFSHLVCMELKEYICGNAGVNSYGIYNTVMRSRFDQKIQEADIFVYLFPPDDFLRDYRNANTAHFYLNNKKFILPAITEAINFVSTKYNLKNYISKKDDTNENAQNKYNFIDYSVDILKKELQNKSDNEKITFVFLSNRKNDKKLNNKVNFYIKNKLEKSIKIHSLTEILNKDIYFYDESVHLSRYGHKVVADEIIKKIKDKIYFK